MARLAGHVAVVTGGAQGIGGATARRLAEEGARVLIVDIDAPAAERNAATIATAGGEAAVLIGDVTRHDDVRRMVETAVTRWGKLTLLVNNAFGGAPGMRGSAVDVSEAAWNQGLGALMTSIFLGVKEAVPHLQAAGGGAIVNIASVHGLLMSPGSLVYEAGKSAVIGMTRQMACDFGPLGIRVNAICPGHIVTERMRARWADNESGLRFFDAQYPVRRTGTPADIANAVAFLCSDDASFITGHALVVDGGLTIQLQEDLGVALAHYMRAHPETQLPY
ncbi:MAG: SDR family oxidoreductase [Chloroflexi bacterium]|nr:SDR family oxidoreductase [Chloroflexota bacterium]